MKGVTTKILHTKLPKNDPHGSIHMPIYGNVSFEFETSKELADAFNGRINKHIYSRISNPTVSYFEKRIKSITDGLGVLALSSGMGAIANVILTLVGAGDNIVCTKYVFGNTYSLLKYTLSKYNIETRFVDPQNYKEIEEAIDAKTRLIFLESITNPQLYVTDFERVAKIAKNYKVLLVADTTATPPPIFRAKDFGIDIEVISSTKFISGGATSVGGLIIDYGSYKWSNNPYLYDDYKKFGPYAFISKLRNEVFRNIGACLSPYNAYLQSLGLETIQLRVEKACKNALVVAEYLNGISKVKNVRYPRLKNYPDYTLAKKFFPDYQGAILTFELSSEKECFEFMDNLKIIKKSTNIHDNRTLIIHPASTIFCEYPKKERERLGVTDSMIRLSVGIEDVEDILEDLDNALKGIGGD
ncbi:O-acetylhomoserine aminocarboxypropyltransferase/cysteine synthase [Deferribacter autotrophicus]|uniref:O-acetylhomoserine aminocarboxypropyltransferase/cysteine synthase n=1 Tax=Deferribacter autotrophicus TaxID=500465 RepID=A0A5A8F0P7_9BACT|nr:aminotransferase class V-fold PLP-dependent enzyme [Deferribacter autotrophicus]KAA0257163.1 O-acetylhomoserine aminocarboxypropyltransferase/cysteine synthase [Deferribacter autotrophicus]